VRRVLRDQGDPQGDRDIRSAGLLKSERFKNTILLLLIILLALVVRFRHYTGPIGSDDTWYYLGAYEIHEGSYEPGDNYWRTRYGMLLPIAASYKAFGTNEFAAALWPMLCSLGAVALCYFLGKLVVNSTTGFLAATLLAFYPLDIHYSGLILPDVPLSFLMAASVLAFLHGSRSEKRAPAFYFLSGALMAVAYSCRSMAVILLPFFGIYVLLFEKKIKPSHFLFAVGFLGVLSFESLYFALKGLGPLHNFQLNAQAAIEVNSSGECSTSQTYYPTSVLHPNIMPVFGPYFYLFLPALIFAAVKRERGGLIFFAWAAVILLILQFGYVSLFPPIPMVKVRKFLCFASVPLVLTAGYALAQLRIWYRWAVVVALAAISLFLIRAYTYSHNMTPEAWGGFVRQAGEYLQEQPPKTIYAEGRTSGMLRLVTDFELEADLFVDLYDVSSADELENCYVVVNRFYAVFDQTNPYANVPDFITANPPQIPPYWKSKDFGQSVVFDVP
jgi:4-amino-4-deoxy-L-arabinose transferase-like glycosyltransferase